MNNLKYIKGYLGRYNFTNITIFEYFDRAGYRVVGIYKNKTIEFYVPYNKVKIGNINDVVEKAIYHIDYAERLQELLK